MTHLHLFENELTGEIPPELGSMTVLQVLYLDRTTPSPAPSRRNSAT